jgi:hypothetical protein
MLRAFLGTFSITFNFVKLFRVCSNVLDSIGGTYLGTAVNSRHVSSEISPLKTYDAKPAV